MQKHDDLTALNEPNALRDAMLEAARCAAAHAIACGREGLTTQLKSDGSTVTNGDLKAEQVILQHMNRYAQAQGLGADQLRFLGEESPEALAKNLDALPAAEREAIVARNKTVAQWQDDKSGLYLIIDPIDGTGNYKRSFPSEDEKHHKHRAVLERNRKPWAVSIALQKDGQTIAAALYEAASGEHEARIDPNGKPHKLKGKLYWAEKGKGAYVVNCTGAHHARKLHCEPKAPIADECTAYLEHFVPDSDAKGMPPTHITHGPLYKSQAHVFNNAGIVIDNVLSACVAALHVACGQDHKPIRHPHPICAFSHGFACPWDWAATSLVLAEAGVPVLVAEAGQSQVNPGTPPLAIMLTARNALLAQHMIDNYQQALAKHYPNHPVGEVYIQANLEGHAQRHERKDVPGIKSSRTDL